MPRSHLVASHPLHTDVASPATTDVLAIDIGGSGIKAAVVDAQGNLRNERVRIDTPTGAHPDEVTAAIAALVDTLPRGNRVAVGFPGMVRNGKVLTAPNLGHEAWAGFDLAGALGRALHAEVRVQNDADVQGLAVITGTGLEMVVTLGTGFGTALYEGGRLCPHLEIAHLRFRKGETYDEQLGEAARKKVGTKKWKQRVHKAIANMRGLVMFDRLYLGGGNSKRLQDEVPLDCTIVDNQAGIAGGAFLWRDAAAK